MNRSSLVALLALSSLACSAKGTTPPAPVADASNDTTERDAAPSDVTAPSDGTAPSDVSTADVPTADLTTVDATSGDAPSVDVTASDGAMSDTASADVAPARCTRDLDCSGVTFCSPDGLCVPLVCTPGRLMCVSPARAQVCDGRGATFAEMDCPGGCVLNNCMGATTTCPSPRVTCSGACTDVQTSATHCGRCGNACATGQTCVGGVCSVPCVAPNVVCGAACVDARTSNAHCGRCNNACPSGQTCLGAVCTATCAAPLVSCGGACTDVQTSTTHCGRCGNACAAGQSCAAGVCTAVTTSGFRVLSLTTTGCQTVEHNAETGDDRGGIALAGDRLFYNADTRLGRWQAADLSGFAALTGPRDGMISDLATGTVYSVLTAEGAEFTGSNATTVVPFAITQLGTLDPSTMALTSTRLALRAPVTITHDAGFFSGHGFLLVFSGVATATVPQQWYRIDLPSGAVTTYPSSGGFGHHVCENGAWWGVAERAGTEYTAVYVRNNMTVGRIRLGDNAQTVVATFTDLADTCSITVSPSRNRWYFHFEGASEIAPAGVETTGYCAGTFALTP